MQRFTRLLPGISRIKRVAGDEETIYWEVYDSSGSLIGYAFAADVPEMAADVEETEEMDRYQILGVVDPKEYKVIALDISLHPLGPEEPWAESITKPEFEKQYVDLTVEELKISPEGKIDAITEATLSSTWVTDAIRERIREIIRHTRATP
jgi:hypothetical protein